MMTKKTYKTGAVLEVPEGATFVIGIDNSEAIETQAKGNPETAVLLLIDLMAGTLKKMNEVQRASALAALRTALLDKGILDENVKMKVTYRGYEAPDDPKKVLLDLVERFFKKDSDQ